MSDTSVLVLEPAGATAEVDAEGLGTGPQGKPLRRERFELAGALLAEISRVMNAAPAGTEYALVVRPIPSTSAQPVSAVTLPLPTNAASATKQDTGNTSLGSLDTKLPVDPAREGGNLALLVAKDFATQATLALVAKDATLGTVGPTAGAYTVLDRLTQIGLKLDVEAGLLRQQLAALPARPAVRPLTTLLHRS